MDNGAAVAASDDVRQGGRGWLRNPSVVGGAAWARSPRTGRRRARPARPPSPRAQETAARAPPTPTLHSSSYSLTVGGGMGDHPAPLS